MFLLNIKFKEQYLNPQFWICDKRIREKEKITSNFAQHMFSYLDYGHYKMFFY